MPRSIPQPSRAEKIPVAWDTETHLIKPGLLAPPMVCVSFAYRGESGIIHAKDPAARQFVIEVLQDPAVISVGANMPYDLGVVMAEWPDLTPLVFDALDRDRVEDVQTRQRLIDIARGDLAGYRFRGAWHQMKYSLADLERRHLARDRAADKGPDAWRLRYGELADTPIDRRPEAARQYPIDDAEGTLGVYFSQRDHEHYLNDSFRQTRAHMALHLMSCRGLVTDARAVDLYLERTKRDIEAARETAMAAGLVQERKRPTKAQAKKGVPGPWFKKNMKIAQQRMERVYPDCPRTKPSKTHPNGYPQLDEENVLTSGDEALIAYQKFTTSAKRINDVYDLYKGAAGSPLQTRFTPVLDTGRTSSSGPNVQNRSRAPGDRECFVARDGWVFGNADYDGVELRTLAQACLILLGRSALADALNAGKDPHVMLASTMLGIDYETEGMPRYEDDDAEVAGARQDAKPGNFGFPGGMGVPTFVVTQRKNGNYYTLERATEVREAFVQTWDEMAEYFRMIGREANGGAYLMQLGSERYRGDMTYSQACNTYFQGLAADAAKAAMWALAKACYVPGVDDALYGCRPVNFVHDEFIVEMPDDEWAHDRVTRMAEIMCEATRPWVPDVPLTAGPLLMRRWSKAAKDRYDAEGRLVPWDCDPARPVFRDDKIVGFEEVFAPGVPTFAKKRGEMVQVNP